MDPQAQNTPPNTPETNQPNLEQNPSTEEYPQESPKRTSKMKKMGINILATIILLAFIMIALWIYKNKISKPSLVQPPPSPTQNEWKEYKDDYVSFEYPTTWKMIDALPQNFENTLSKNIEKSCKSRLFLGKNISNELLIVDSYEGPLQESSFYTCWRISGTVKTENFREVKYTFADSEIRMYITELVINDTPYMLQRYGFYSDFKDREVYQLTFIYPRNDGPRYNGIYDRILESFEYLEKYEVATPSEFTVFRSEELGYGFEYPVEWGLAHENIEDAITSGYGESGKYYRLLFQEKSNIQMPRDAYGVGQSSDYSAGRGGTFFDYRGDENEPTQVSSRIDFGLYQRCFSDMAPYGNFVGVIEFNLPDEEISGVRLVVPVLSKEDRNYYNDLILDFLDSKEFCKSRELDNIPSESQLEELNGKEEEILEMIRNREHLNEESVINLEIFERIEDSASVRT